MKSSPASARRGLLAVGGYLGCLVAIIVITGLSWQETIPALALFVAVIVGVKAWLGSKEQKQVGSVRESYAVGQYEVALSAVGPHKIETIRRVRYLRNTSLKQAKDLVDNLPAVLINGIAESDANRVASDLRDIGAQVLIARQDP